MTDYELYGDYNRGEDEEPMGPAPSRFGVWVRRLLRILLIAIMASTCLLIAFRMIVSGYYPDAVKYLYRTDALAAYAAEAGESPTILTQKIRVPFESEYLEASVIEETQRGEERNGYFCAANLLVARETGSVQFSLRMNRQALYDVAAAYGVPASASPTDAFTFTLVAPDGTRYAPSHTETDSALFYRYVKLCYDGVSFDEVPWLRVEIEVVGADMTAPEHPPMTICVYENHVGYAAFDTYKLHKKERF